jgi:flagellar biosynthesis protein FliR
MAWTVVSLLQDTFSDKPIDRRTIFFIALDLSALVVFLVFKIVHIIIDALLKQAEIQRLTAEFIQQSVAEAVNLLKPPENTKQPE